MALNNNKDRLYAANFRFGTVEVFDASWTLVDSITDPTIPPGYAPFNIQNLFNNQFGERTIHPDGRTGPSGSEGRPRRSSIGSHAPRAREEARTRHSGSRLGQELPWRHHEERERGASPHPESEVALVARDKVGRSGRDGGREDWPVLGGQLRRRQPVNVNRCRFTDDLDVNEVPLEGGQRRWTLGLEVPLRLVDGQRRGEQGQAPRCADFDDQRGEPAGAARSREQDVRVQEDAEVSHARGGGRGASSAPSAGAARPAPGA